MRILLLTLATLIAAANTKAFAEPPATPAGPPLVRELFVPFDDLNILLDADKHRVFLPRKEYEELLTKAKQKPADPQAPWSAAVLYSQYQCRVIDGRAVISGNLEIEVLNDDVHAIPLAITGVGLRSARWDNTAAPLGRQPDGQVLLFATGKGKHTLALEMTAPVSESAAQQVLQVQVPQGAVSGLNLTVAGNVELKGGAAVRKRTFDMGANETKFELNPPRGGWGLVLSLNNRQKKAERVLVARSVIVDEVTQAYERIHARIAFRVLHGTGETLKLAIPNGFEVTEVTTPLLAKWTVNQAPEARILELTLREPAVETVVVDLTAIKTDVDLVGWKFPTLAPMDVAGHVALATVLLEERLRLGEIAAEGALPIDAATLAAAIPASVLRVEAGSPSVRQVATYYSPQGKIAIQANVLKPSIGLRVVTSSLLLLEDKQLSLRGGFALTPEAEEIFSLGFRVPTGWRIMEVTHAGGNPLPLERFPLPDGGTRVLVRFAEGLPVNRATSINYAAVATPQDWFKDWMTKELDFPVITVEGADREQGAVAVHAIDDLVVTPGELTNLLPLLENEKANYGFGDLPTTLAYYYEKTPYAAKLKAERPAPSLAADVHSFYRVERDRVAVRYEVTFTIRERRTRELAFWLPKTTPEEISIDGLGVAVKEYAGKTIGDRRLWKLSLAERQGGTVRIAVEFDQTHALEKETALLLPQLEADGVDYQSVLLAIENTPELDIDVLRHPRPVDVGELSGAEYELGRRVVGAYGYTGAPVEVKIAVTQHQPIALPSALVERAELVTIVDPASRAGKGISQSAARFLLKTKATLLELELPANATLWTATLDGQPTKPQKQGQKLLISLPTTTAEQTRDLQIVYEAPSSPLGLAGEVRQFAPRLRLPSAGSAEELLLADMVWHLWLPTGYQVTRTNGTVFTSEVATPEAPVWRSLGWLTKLLGGFGRQQSNYSGWTRYGHPAAKSAARYSVDEFAPQNEMDYAARTPESAPMEAPQTASPEGGRRLLGTPQSVLEESTLRLDDSKNEPKPASDLPQLVKPARPADQRVFDDKIAQAANPQPTGDGFINSREDVTQKANLGKFKFAVQSWALEGVRCLPIELQPTNLRKLEFRSLGSAPELRATLVDDRRISFAAWGAGLVVLLVGLSRCCRPVSERLTFLVTILAGASLLALLPGMFRDLLPIFDACFFAGLLVGLCYLVAGLLCGSFKLATKLLPACCRFCCRTASVGTTTAVLLLVAALLPANLPAQQDIRFADLIPLLEGGGPVTIPADAVVIPYDPAQEDAIAKAEKILVPYETYVKLWNRANPDKKLPVVKAPADYSLAGLAYETRLLDGDQLLITGKLTIHVYSDKPVAVPLTLEGGVVAEAKIDGQPARLQVVDCPPEQAAKGKPAAVPPPMLLLHLTGRGEKTLDISLRFPIQRQGGRRVVEGRLPTGPAAAVTFIVPEAGSEVRLPHTPDRQTHETKQADEKLETALSANGLLRVEWRPKVAVAMIDSTLTADSTVLLDVREDAVRVAWQLAFQFRGGARETFELGLPDDYLVERVAGDNIRGWQIRTENGKRRLDIQLLKPATTNESFTVHLARRGSVGQAELATFNAPLVETLGAVLHQGQLVVRRTPRLELQIGNTQGLTRADIPPASQPLMIATEELDASVMELRPYQAYRFATTPFVLPLTVRPATAGATAEIHSLLRLAERLTTLETNFVIKSATPIYRLRVHVPEDFDIAAIEPTDLEWSSAKKNGKQLVQILFPQGQIGKATVALRGQLLKREGDEVLAPIIEVLDVDRQEGELVVQADPDVDILATELKDSEPVFLMQTLGWLRAEQHTLAKTAIRYRSPNYAAKFKRQPKTAVVSARTLTNVKVTRRAVEETSVLYFDVTQAGVSELVFQLPQALEKARIKVPLLRQKTVEPVVDAPGWVRVKLQLQDDRIGQIRVLIEHDRLVTADKQSVALPKIESGKVEKQILALESAGRDEVIIDGHPGLQPLSRQQPDWRSAAAVLGDRITQVYVGESETRKQELAFHLQDRAQVETSGARIGLAETVLIVDASGAYRALQQYRVENFTQPYLEVQLPAGAVLWTSTVAGEPVKPTPGKTADLVRIPLVKTAEGEADYPVILKYGGNIPSLRSLQQVKFPLARTTNVNVELSQVRLFLPESQKWFNFDGTMRQTDEPGLAVGYLSYMNKQLGFACSNLNSENPFTQARATNNLKQLGLAVQNFNSANSFIINNDSESSRLNMDNGKLLADSQRQIMQIEVQRQQQADLSDNRDRLNDDFGRQSVERAKNAVTKLGSNFSASQPVENGRADFNRNWFENNKLSGATAATKVPPGKDKPDVSGPRPNAPGAQPNAPLGNVQQQRFSRAAPQSKSGAVNPAEPNDPALAPLVNKAPQVAGEKGKKQLQEQLEGQKANDGEAKGEGKEGEEFRNLAKYQKKLEQQLDSAPQQSLAQNPSGGQGQGGQQQGQAFQQEGQLAQNDQSVSQFLRQPRPGFDDTNGGIGGGGGIPAATTSPVPTGLASLDVEIPPRGQSFFFTKPRGDVEITARPVPHAALNQWWGLAMLGLALLVVLAASRIPYWQSLPGLFDNLVSDVLLTLLGLTGLILAIFPVLAVGLLLVGLVRCVLRLVGRGLAAA